MQINPYLLQHGPLSLSKLLGMADTDFIEAAYHIILNRGPNEADTAYFRREIASGTSKIVLLGRLKQSPEARRAARPLKGLMRRYHMQRLSRVPFLGLGVRIVAKALRAIGLSRAIEDQIFLQLKAAPLDRLDMLRTTFEDQFRMQDASLEEALRQIVALQARLTERSSQDEEPAKAMRRLRGQDAPDRGATATTKSGIGPLFAPATQNKTIERRLDELEDSNIEALLAMNDRLDNLSTRLSRLEGLITGIPLGLNHSTGKGRWS